MSVYTTVNSDQLAHFLQRYDIGKPTAFTAIEAGITNTNYALDTGSGRYVLTLYEHHSDDELDYMLTLQRHLAARGLRCSKPVADRRGEFFSTLNQRPAAIIERLPGEVCAEPGQEQLAQIGAELARFHLAGADFDGFRFNPRGLDWIVAATDMLREQLDDTDQLAIAATLRASRQCQWEQLPSGAVHADLFHDNALFDQGSLAGILDFDYACVECFVFDIAVLLNDWCVDDEAGLVAGRVASVLDAYQQQRPLSTAEIDAIPLMLRIAALRFWLSRLYDRAFPLTGELTFTKDPDWFCRMHRLRSDGLPAAVLEK